MASFHDSIIAAWLCSIAFVLMASTASGADQAIVEPANSCSASAYINDHDVKGLNVRSGPGTAYGVIAAITTAESEVEVRISGSTGRWVRIEGADPVEEVEVYKGKGWVYGPKLAVTARTPARIREKGEYALIYAKPDPKSAVVGRVAFMKELIITGCSGEWLRVKFGNKEGWLDPESYCGNPVTTCV